MAKAAGGGGPVALDVGEVCLVAAAAAAAVGLVLGRTNDAEDDGSDESPDCVKPGTGEGSRLAAGETPMRAKAAAAGSRVGAGAVAVVVGRDVLVVLVILCVNAAKGGAFLGDGAPELLMLLETPAAAAVAAAVPFPVPPPPFKGDELEADGDGAGPKPAKGSIASKAARGGRAVMTGGGRACCGGTMNDPCK